MGWQGSGIGASGRSTPLKQGLLLIKEGLVSIYLYVEMLMVWHPLSQVALHLLSIACKCKCFLVVTMEGGNRMGDSSPETWDLKTRVTALSQTIAVSSLT